MLKPTLARTYVGRIVFASLCDKLVDIDEKLNIVPSSRSRHGTSDDNKVVTMKLRPGVKFQDGEPIDAEAAKFRLERHLTLPGSYRKPDLAALETSISSTLTVKLVLKTPFSPLIAQLSDRAGMIVSPKAAKEEGDKFGLHPVCAGPYKFVERVQQDRIVFEKFADYWNKDNILIDRVVFLPIVDSTVRLADLKSGGLDLIERLPATDIRTCAPIRSSGCRPRSHSAIRASPSTSATTRTKARSASPPRSARRSNCRSIGRPSTRSCSTASSRPATSGSAGASLLPEGFAGPHARHRQGQGAAEGGRRHRCPSASISWCRKTPRPKPWPR